MSRGVCTLNCIVEMGAFIHTMPSSALGNPYTGAGVFHIAFPNNRTGARRPENAFAKTVMRCDANEALKLLKITGPAPFWPSMESGACRPVSVPFLLRRAKVTNNMARCASVGISRHKPSLTSFPSESRHGVAGRCPATCRKLECCAQEHSSPQITGRPGNGRQVALQPSRIHRLARTFQRDDKAAVVVDVVRTQSN